jgi:SAM-dependent methyltransferase
MTEIQEVDATARWNELHAVPRFSPRYPSELVVRWTFRNFPRERAGEFSLLDVGAGAGRHAALWARDGYIATASDVSPLAMSQVREWARQEGLAIAVEVAEADALPFSDESFDGILSFGVLYYLPYARMRRAIAEIWRVLKPGGKAFVMVKSDADSRCCRAERVDRWSYRVGVPESGASWGSEVGMVLTLLDRGALQDCFADFSEAVIDRSTVTTCNGRFVDDEWLIQLRK